MYAQAQIDEYPNGGAMGERGVKVFKISSVAKYSGHNPDLGPT